MRGLWSLPVYEADPHLGKIHMILPGSLPNKNCLVRRVRTAVLRAGRRIPNFEA